MYTSSFSEPDTGLQGLRSWRNDNPFNYSRIVFWQNSRCELEMGAGFVAVLVPHNSPSPLLRGAGQGLRPWHLWLLGNSFLVAAAWLEEVGVDKNFPKTAFIDDPTADFLPERTNSAVHE